MAKVTRFVNRDSKRMGWCGCSGPGKRLLAAAAIALVLPACTTENHDDLVAYIDQVKSRKVGRVEPLPDFETYESFQYIPGDRRNPFQPAQQEARVEETKQKPVVADNGIRPDAGRHKEALESFPLDTLNFVGLLTQGERSWAIVTAPDGLVYRAQIGNYIGQNYGRITRITETKVSIVEIVPDGRGGWVERDAALSIND